MAKKKRTGSALSGESAAAQSRSPHSKRQPAMPISAGGTRLQLPPGEPDLEALRSATREWLVPRLVEKFLQVHGIELKHSRKFGSIANRLQLSLPADGIGSSTSAGAVSKRIRSQAKKKNQYRKLR